MPLPLIMSYIGKSLRLAFSSGSSALSPIIPGVSSSLGIPYQHARYITENNAFIFPGRTPHELAGRIVVGAGAYAT